MKGKAHVIHLCIYHREDNAVLLSCGHFGQVLCPFVAVPVVKKTWQKHAALIEYYSDHADATIPTINLGVPNTERGKSTIKSFCTLHLLRQANTWKCTRYTV